MKKIGKFIAIVAMMAFLLVPTRSAQAQDPSGEGGKVVFGEDFTLKSGKTLEGDLVVIGGNVKIEEGAELQGSFVVVGGNVSLAEDAAINGDAALIGVSMKMDGILNGDLALIGGQVTLTETAVVHGDIALIGGQVEQDPKAQVDGDIIENIPAPSIDIPDIPNVPTIPEVPESPETPSVPDVNVGFNPFWSALNVLLRALAVAALAMLLTLFLDPNMQRVADAIVRQPVVAGSFGLLTVVLAPIVLLIMVVTLVLSPVAVLAAFLLPLAWLFGVIAIGQEVGERFTKAINQSWAPVLTCGFGTFLLMLVGGYMGMIPCVGWLLPVLLGLIGIGGVIMTWFGTRPAPGAMVQQPPVEVPPAS